MDVPTSLIVVAFAALIQASFQLSIGVLSLLSGHALSARKSHKHIVRLTTSYIIGAGVMTLLLLSFIALIFLHSFQGGIPLIVWAVVCGLAFGIGLAVWLFYYKHRSNSTELWIPRLFADYLHSRSKATRSGAESFSLGLTSVAAELIFIMPSLAITALVLIQLPSSWQLIGLALYTVISLLGLIIAWSMIGSGRSLAHIQKWRVENKRFLQFAGGGALLVLGFFLYVSQVVSIAVGAS